MVSPWRRSPSRSSREPIGAARSGRLPIYLLPAVVGAGRGDVEELRSAAWAVRSSRVQLHLYRPEGIPWPLGPGELSYWPVRSVERHLAIEGDRAMTISTAFGVTAEKGRAGPFGRAGPWAATVDRIESMYGADRVVHVSLEEFARNLTAEEQESERFREAGRTLGELRELRSAPRWERDVARMGRLYRKYRSLDRSNLLVLLPTFRGSPEFRRQFPEIVECGPIRSHERTRRGSRPRSTTRRTGPAEWIWYASPATSSRLIDGIAQGAQRSGRPLRILFRSPRGSPPSASWKGVKFVGLPAMERKVWATMFRRAELRIVTGSRSLLEALELGGPFLYFNGALGQGASRRAHRPEKLLRLLALWRSSGVAPSLCSDLAEFSRARNVASVVKRALTEPSWSGSFPSAPIPAAFPPPRAQGDRWLRLIALDWASGAAGSNRFVRRWRSRT